MRSVSATYGKQAVLSDINLDLQPGHILAVIGRNGAGKTTLLKVVSGLLKVSNGGIWFNDREVTGLELCNRAKLGAGYCMQGGRVFRSLSVKDNLRIASVGIAQSEVDAREILILEMFPRLKAHYQTTATLLSGGERQSLALGMVLIRRPFLLLLDEPSSGLSPILLGQLAEQIRSLAREWRVAVLVAEQNIHWALELADQAVLLRQGKILFDLAASELLAQPAMLEAAFLN
jgi:branched-chain amino acid transport system ATP-binding protein